MNNAVCVGYGMVGKATAHVLGIKSFYDSDPNKLSTVPFDEIKNFTYIFLCIPTPTVQGTQPLDDFLYLINQLKSDTNIFIIRSTILPGTCKKLEQETGATIIHMPEFLTESSWQPDVEYPELVVIGGNNNDARSKIEGIFRQRYKTVGPTFVITDTDTSEMIKYAINGFYASKVVYANQIYDLCERLGINYSTVRDAMYARRWVDTNHLDVWHNDKRGAGGKCLGKDLDALAHFAQVPLLELVNSLNKQYLAQEKE